MMISDDALSEFKSPIAMSVTLPLMNILSGTYLASSKTISHRFLRTGLTFSARYDLGYGREFPDKTYPD